MKAGYIKSITTGLLFLTLSVSGCTETQKQKESLSVSDGNVSPTERSATGSGGPHAPQGNGGESFEYDRNGAVTQHSDSSGNVTAYEYDVNLRVIGQTYNEQPPFRNVYDGSGNKIASYYPNGKVVLFSQGTEFIYETGSSVKVRTHYGIGYNDFDNSGDHFTYTVTDHLGSLVATTDENEFTELKDNLPYGESWYQEAFTEPAVRDFNGNLLEGNDEAPILDYKARHMTPGNGVFLQADTIVPNANSVLAWNRYSYVENNPVNYTDPTGHYKSTYTGLNREPTGNPGRAGSGGDQWNWTAQFRQMANQQAMSDFRAGELSKESIVKATGFSGTPLELYGALTLLENGQESKPVALLMAGKADGNGAVKKHAMESIQSLTRDYHVVVKSIGSKEEFLDVFADEQMQYSLLDIIVHGLPGMIGPGTESTITGEEFAALDLSHTVSKGAVCLLASCYGADSAPLDYDRRLAGRELIPSRSVAQGLADAFNIPSQAVHGPNWFRNGEVGQVNGTWQLAQGYLINVVDYPSDVAYRENFMKFLKSDSRSPVSPQLGRALLDRYNMYNNTYVNQYMPSSNTQWFLPAR